ncbi:hypothetical protein C1645_835483 [Glomus cerebriforme]|uniref:NrS-1 polymerase-like helicase domain-containing protein n=1 Tax=Glomus cerebriforme TaxID=658196 RepID=A0A397SHU9_9GLOM|nr:hypothetical protein C1645_835483 [Glomus cerebriforme]
MSNSKSTDWITFANRLKDFVDSDTLMIEEKYRISYSVTNITNLIISSNNSKTIRLDKDDRRYFIPDISEKYVKNGIGMDYYYVLLDEAIKNSEVGKAFYSYALEYAKLNPNFNERKIPMTETKLMMVNRNNNKVHEFIKKKFVRYHNEELDMSSSSLYNEFKNWYQEYVNSKKKPSTVQEFTRSLKSLGLDAKQKRVGDQKAGKRLQWYSATYKDLYTTFMKKNMINEAKNIEEPEGYQQSEVFITVPTEILPAKGDVPLKSTSSSSKLEASPKESYSQPVSKKTSSPLPSKPDRLKASIETSNPESIVIQSQEEIVSPADIAKKREEYGVPGPSSTSEKSEPNMPAPKEYIDQKLEDLYTSAKDAWKRDNQDPDEFDWKIFAIKIEDLPNHDTNNLKDHPVPFTQVIPANKLPECPKPNKKEYWQAEGYDDIDDEDEELKDFWD